MAKHRVIDRGKLERKGRSSRRTAGEGFRWSNCPFSRPVFPNRGLDLPVSAQIGFDFFATICRRIIVNRLLTFAAAAAACITLWASPLFVARTIAQSINEPGVIVSIANLKEQLDDIGYLLDGSGFGQFKFMMNMQAKEFLKGVDMERPAGVLLYFESGAPMPKVVGFVPISNMDDVMNSIGSFAEVEEQDNDVISLKMDNGNELFAKEREGLAFLSNDVENLADLPQDPLKLIDNLPGAYNIAVRVFGERIPEETRAALLEQIRQGLNQQLENMEDSDDEMADLQRANMELQMQQIEAFINETELAELGMSIGKETNNLAFDCRLIGKPGSKFAKQVDLARNHKTRFAGFLMKDAAFHGVSHSVISPDDVPAIEKMIDDLHKTLGEKLAENDEMSDDERTAVESLIETLLKTAKATVNQGMVDFGFVGQTKGSQINVAAAMESADPSAVEAEFKKIAPLAKKRSDDKLEINLDAYSANGATFHEFKVAIPEGEEEARKVFGEQMAIQVGFGKDVVFLGLGDGARDLLQQAMSNSAAPPPDLAMTEVNVYLSRILDMVASVQDDKMVTKMAEKLKENGRDRISISGKAIDNGVVTRLEIQDGFLSLIQIAAQQFGAAPSRDF
jgi:hypothetical protein